MSSTTTTRLSSEGSSKDALQQQIHQVYHQPFLDLVYQAAGVHRQHHDTQKIQLSHLLSIKTGGCREDCSYCPQSAHYNTPVMAERLWDTEQIVREAKLAQKRGATRFCMGAAWSSPPKKGRAYDSLLKSAKEVKKLGLEVCMTLGMLDQKQAMDLGNAGVDYYNHNLDTSPEYYQKIITTRTYEDRLRTLQNVRASGMKVCCGGIIGMGESVEDRIGLLTELCCLDSPPESVPINRYVKVPGTPLAPSESFDIFEMVRMIATTRIFLPQSAIRLSAGRAEMSEEAQSLCMLAGANSLFIGDKLLTTTNPEVEGDFELLDKLGIEPHAPSKEHHKQNPSTNGLPQPI